MDLLDVVGNSMNGHPYFVLLFASKNKVLNSLFSAMLSIPLSLSDTITLSYRNFVYLSSGLGKII